MAGFGSRIPLFPVVALAFLPLASAIFAAEPGAREPSALAGHDAEAHMRTPESEARWRRLFFDAADGEEGEPGVACDHRVARHPEAVAGLGAVAVAVDPATGHVRARLWRPPDPAGPMTPPDLAALAARIDARVPQTSAAERPVVDVLAFAWCR